MVLFITQAAALVSDGMRQFRVAAEMAAVQATNAQAAAATTQQEWLDCKTQAAVEIAEALVDLELLLSVIRLRIKEKHMAYMAELKEIDGKLIVERVIRTTDEGDEGLAWCTNTLGGRWLKTSFNATIRGNFAGAGFEYREDIDAFVPPQPFPSWTLNEETVKWEAPLPLPSTDKPYMWDETSGAWVEIEGQVAPQV